jgi:hypothetical protein
MSYVQCQEDSKIPGKRGNVADADADILEVSFQLLENKSFMIKYVIAGNFVQKYFYGINLYAYEENRTFGNIILGYQEQRRGVYFIDTATMRIKPLPYSIQGSTLTITGLTLADLEDRYAFYARAQTAYEKDYKLIWIDGEPQEGAIRIMFPSPSPSPPQTTSTPTITPTVTQIVTTSPRIITPTHYQSPTTVLAIIVVLSIIFGIVLWRSKPKSKVRDKMVTKK